MSCNMFATFCRCGVEEICNFDQSNGRTCHIAMKNELAAGDVRKEIITRGGIKVSYSKGPLYFREV